MAKNKQNQANRTAQPTDAAQIRQQNQQSAQNNSEFASEITDPAQVRQQNQKAEAQKNKTNPSNPA